VCLKLKKSIMLQRSPSFFPLVADRASFVYLPQWETPYGTPQAGETIKLKIQALLINGIRVCGFVPALALPFTTEI
jgi:hypothetical protein